jgi:SulP family sulfate permease
MNHSRLKNFIPKSILSFQEGYSFPTFKSDLIAGLSVAIIAFPLAMAYSIGAGLPPERGLFTAIVAGFLISLLGGSRVQIGGPTGAMIIVLYGLLMEKGFESMTIAALMAGVILIFFGLTGLGTYIKYIPYPVITGLTTGIAVAIFTSQIKDFFGLSLEEVPIDFLSKWQLYFHKFGTMDVKTFAVGLGTLGIIIYFRKFKPQFPGALVALIAAGFITWYFGIDVETVGSHYGTLPNSLPFPTLPAFTFAKVIDLLPDALTIALLCAIESLLSAIVSEGMTGWRTAGNCELVAQGFANIGSLLFGGLPAAGALARTAANVKSGAKTPVAGMIHALTLLVILFFFAPLTAKIPLCALSAVLLMIAWSMSEIHHFLHLFTAPKRDIVVLITVFLLSLLANVTFAVQVGMVLAAFLFMKQMSDLTDVVGQARLIDEEALEAREDKDALSKKDVPMGVEIYEINGPFFFGVADRLKNVMNELQKPPKIFILRMRKVPTIDASGMHALEEFYIECNRQGTLLLLSGVKKNPLKDLKRYHLDELIGSEHIFSHVDSALRFSREYLLYRDGEPTFSEQIPSGAITR